MITAGTDYYNREKYKTRSHVTNWKENYTCKKCGYEFYYKKSRRDTYEVDASK